MEYNNFCTLHYSISKHFIPEEEEEEDGMQSLSKSSVKEEVQKGKAVRSQLSELNDTIVLPNTFVCKISLVHKLVL